MRHIMRKTGLSARNAKNTTVIVPKEVSDYECAILRFAKKNYSIIKKQRTF